MGEDDRPPLSRRVPSENRGHKPAARVGVRQLSDEVVARMRAAVEAGAAAETRDTEAPAERAAALGVMTPPSGVPIAEPDGPAPESAPRTSHKASSARRPRKRAARQAQAQAKQEPAADPVAADRAPAPAAGPGEAAKPLPRRAGPPRPGAAPAAAQAEPDADTEQFIATPSATAPGDESGPVAPAPVSAFPAAEPLAPEPSSAAPPPAPSAPEQPPLPASTITPGPARASRWQAAGRRYRAIGAAAVVAALILAGGLILMFRPAPRSAPPPAAISGAAAARSNAATWIANQVGLSVLISCDPAMCQALASDGFPPDDTRPLSPGGSPLNATLVVATAAVRRDLGTRLTTLYAPAVIARFGSGASRIDVRLVAQHGPAAFRAALSEDVYLRRQTGQGFLSSGRVGFSAQANPRIHDGQVDSRLLGMLTQLAAARPILIESVGDAAPGGASLEVSPLRSAVIEQIPGGAQDAGPDFVATMLSILRAARGPFKLASYGRVQLPGGQVGVRMVYAAPEPLGLWNTGSLPAAG
jgi:hypothetical protein